MSIAANCACLGLILGPMAWIMANNDLRAIREGIMDPRGESNTNAGRICGIIGTILCVLPCCGWPTFFVIGNAHH
jgi:hypothetical protein